MSKRRVKLLGMSLLTAVTGATLMGAPAKGEEKVWSCEDFRLMDPLVVESNDCMNTLRSAEPYGS